MVHGFGCKAVTLGVVLGSVLHCAIAADGGAADSAGEKEADDGHGISVNLSYDVSRGNYGGQTEILNWNRTLSVEIDRGAFNFSASLPYIRQYGPIGTIFVAGHPVIVHGKPLKRNGKTVVVGPTVETQIGTVDGVGDANVAATYFFESGSDDAPLYDLKLNAKLRTGDEQKGLGSGTMDYSFQGDVSQVFGDWLISASIGYTFVGSIPEAHLRNYLTFSSDLSYKLAERRKVGIIFSSSQAAAEGSPAARDLTLYYQYEWPKVIKVQAYYLKGLQKGSPDQGGGLNLNVNY